MDKNQTEKLFSTLARLEEKVENLDNKLDAHIESNSRNHSLHFQTRDQVIKAEGKALGAIWMGGIVGGIVGFLSAMLKN